MRIYEIAGLCAASAILVATAQGTEPVKAAPGKVHAAPSTHVAKAAPSTAVKSAKAPAMEQLSCRSGPNDRQTRLVVQAVQGRPMEFAYYSRLGTRVCSIAGRRGDFYSKWEDQGSKSLVKLLNGNAEL